MVFSGLKRHLKLIKISQKKSNEGNEKRYFVEAHFQYPEKLHDLHNDLPFLPERMKIEKDEKLVANFHDKKEYFIHIKNLKQALNHGFVLKKVHKFINSSKSLAKIIH